MILLNRKHLDEMKDKLDAAKVEKG